VYNADVEVRTSVLQIEHIGRATLSLEASLSPIQDEIDAYEAMQARLEAEHMGEWVLMRDHNVIGFFPSFETAAAEGLLRFGRESYLIREIGAAPISLPVSVIYHHYGS